MAAKSFTELEVWKTGHKLVLYIYGLTKQFPKEELFGLTSQMKRSVASITANIAEGFGRRGTKEKEQFYLIAAGSLFELKDQLLIARDVSYVTDLQFDEAAGLANKCHAQLNALLAKHRSVQNSKFVIQDSNEAAA